jgi:hypothetical protein
MSISTTLANVMAIADEAMENDIRTRAHMVLESLEILNRLDGTPGHRFENRLDLKNVGLMGHSKGGDAVVKAAKLNQLNPTPGGPYGIKAVCSLAPTDFTGTARDEDRLKLESGDTSRYLVLYGSQDGDVTGIEGGNAKVGTGFRHYDRATCDRTMIFVKGITHNRFNTKWNDRPHYGDGYHPFVSHPDCPSKRGDKPVGPGCPPFNRLIIRSAAEHQQLAKEYIGGFFRFVLKNEASRERLLNGLIVPTGNYSVSIQWSFGKKVRTIDNFERRDDSTFLGGKATFYDSKRVAFVDATVGTPPVPVNPHVQHQTRVLEVMPGGSYRADIPKGSRDFGNFRELTFRMTQWFDVTSPSTTEGTPYPRFKVRIEYHADGVTRKAEVDQSALDRRGVRPPNRPFFQAIYVKFDKSFTPRDLHPEKYKVISKDKLGVMLNVTKVALDTLVIPLARFKGVNWKDVRAIEFAIDTENRVPVHIDSLAVIEP